MDREWGEGWFDKGSIGVLFHVDLACGWQIARSKVGMDNVKLSLRPRSGFKSAVEVVGMTIVSSSKVALVDMDRACTSKMA